MNRRLWILLIVGVIMGVVFAEWNPDHVFGVTTGHHGQTAQPSHPEYCLNYEPCSYKPGGVVNAYNAGALGPKYVTVPVVVEKAIRAKVRSRGPRFVRRVRRNVSWYDSARWTLNCVPAVAIRQLSGSYYPRCLSVKRLKANDVKLRRIAIGCGQSALVAAGVGGLFGKTKGAIITALGDDVGCMVDKAFSLAENDWKAMNKQRGYRSAVPGSGSNY